MHSPKKVAELAKEMLGYRLTTKQTPADGVEVKKVCAEFIIA